MYLLADAAIDIACPSTEAFDFACDLENFAEWFPGVIDVVAHNDVPFSERGREYHETVVVPLRGRRSVLIRVVDAEAPRWLVTEGDLSIVMPRMEIRITPSSPQRCIVHWRMFSRNTGALARLLVLPIARTVMTKRASAGLNRLKERLERPETCSIPEC
jgi:Polyketide cyclase / dehydrase and lipid transport